MWKKPRMRKSAGDMAVSLAVSTSISNLVRLQLPIALALSLALSMAFGQESPEIAGQEQQQASIVPTFSIVPRIPELTYYPCLQCHEFMTPNPQVRQLLSPHPSDLIHGDQRFWCLTCHKTDDRNYLTNLLGESIEFDNAAEVCASCHMQRHLDWTFGGHGKRQANWQGERVIFSCPHCHDPHDPSIKARAPQPLPPVRKGLERHAHDSENYEPAWKKVEKRNNE
jgi:hypothetical protein